MKPETFLFTLFILSASAVWAGETLPFVSDFSKRNMEGWTEVSPGSWTFDEFGGYWQGEPGGVEKALVSCGFEAYGTVRVKIVYGASAWGEGKMSVAVRKVESENFEIFENFEASTITVYEDYGYSGAREAEFCFEMEEAGRCRLMIVNEEEDEWGEALRLRYVSVSAVKDFDLRISDVWASLSPFTPVGQIGSETPVTVRVENRGKKDFQNITATAYLNKIADSATLARPLRAGETAEIEILADLSAVGVGDVFSLEISVEGNSADEYPDDNIYITPTVEVTESLRAAESLAEAELGVGAWGDTLRIGNVFALAREDVLTAVEIGLTAADESLLQEKEIGVAVYEIASDGVTLGRTLFSQTMRRGDGGEFVRIPINPMLLRRGSYFFEVAQLSNMNMGLAYEEGEENVCFQNTGGQLERVENGMALAVRGLFDEAVAPAFDAAPVAVVSPSKNKGLYRREQRISASVKNLGYEAAEVSSICYINGERLAEVQRELLPYEVAVFDFGVCDMSAPGRYKIDIETVLEGDENRANDRLTAEFTAVEEWNPYVMDFEACDDFDCQDDVFNPRWRTVDCHSCGTDGFWQFAYPHHSRSAGFIAFNPDATTPSMIDAGFDFRPHSGERFGAAFAVDPYYSGEQIGESDVWLISPKLKLAEGSSLEFFVKTRALEWSGQPLERYQILVSEAEGLPEGYFDKEILPKAFLESFKIVGDEIREALANDWQQVTVDLSAYDHKSVHNAIRYLGLPEQNVVLMVDDIAVHTDFGTGIESLSSDNGEAPMYNVQGIRVGKSFKGLIIKRGEKHFVR